MNDVTQSTYAWLCQSLSVLLLFLVSGCEVPELDVPSDTAEVTSTTKSHESSAAQGEQIAADQQAAIPTGVPISLRRGLALQDWPDGFVYVLVKANVEEIAAVIAEKNDDQVIESILGKSIDQNKLRTLVCQLEGHTWSAFAWFEKEPEQFVADLSRELNTEAIKVSFSDFTGWQFIDVYRAGESVEAFHWGLDYSEELGRGPDLSKWDTHTSVTRNSDGISLTDQFLFRSKIREVSKEELGKGDAFADWLLREHDAFLPGPEFPWPDENGLVTSTLGQASFASIHAVLRKR